ncbi:hypothetical protein ACGRHY_26140 [Streptomyces sp. HK10]|uniref:hypothetical protein n=1 Tax=Streptomyces sp. HK10 TaxID=3373255 RepID=UPI0037479C6A
MSTAPHNHQPGPQQPAPAPYSAPVTLSPGALALVGVLALAGAFTAYLVHQHPELNAPVVAAATVGTVLVAVLALVLRR